MFVLFFLMDIIIFFFFFIEIILAEKTKQNVKRQNILLKPHNTLTFMVYFKEPVKF